MNINILGTEYEVVRQTERENPKLETANGLCEVYSNRIVLREIDDDPNNYENIEAYKRKVFRHEIIHAFLAESGLRADSWAENEEMVDWFASQAPKIFETFVQLDLLDGYGVGELP